jgi:hypothetical protein
VETRTGTVDTTTTTDSEPSQLTPGVPLAPPPPRKWSSLMPSQFKKVIKPGDQEWIAQCLYDGNGQLRQSISQNWFHPPFPPKNTVSPPDPHAYFRNRLFVWAPTRMWGIPLKCTKCKVKMNHGGIYNRAREVIDLDSRYYLVGLDNPKCSKCSLPVCPWSQDVLEQLDPSHRNRFPAVLTKNQAIDSNCLILMKPRTAGNSSSYLRQALQEIHSKEWGKRVVEYLSDCELHKKGTVLTQSQSVYQPPPPFRPLPLAQWFETAHTNETYCHIDELKGVITSTYGRILKLDSTKKVFRIINILYLLYYTSDVNALIFVLEVY